MNRYAKLFNQLGSETFEDIELGYLISKVRRYEERIEKFLLELEFNIEDLYAERSLFVPEIKRNLFD